MNIELVHAVNSGKMTLDEAKAKQDEIDEAAKKANAVKAAPANKGEQAK